jgi:hypothetical protein
MTETTGHQPSRRTSKPILWIVLGLIVALVIVANLSSPDSDPVESDTPTNPADQYVDEYGGERSVYARILGSTDCAFLQG